MNDYAVQLTLEGLSQLSGIITNPLYRYINFPYKRLVTGAEFKADDVGIIIVLKVLPVDLQQTLVG